MIWSPGMAMYTITHTTTTTDGKKHFNDEIFCQYIHPKENKNPMQFCIVKAKVKIQNKSVATVDNTFKWHSFD